MNKVGFLNQVHFDGLQNHKGKEDLQLELYFAEKSGKDSHIVTI